MNLIFDLYGTLIRIHTDEDTKDLWHKLSLFYGYHNAVYKPEELRKKYLKHKKELLKVSHKKDEYPDLPINPVFERLFIDKGVKENVKELSVEAARLFRLCSTEYIELYPHVHEGLKMLKDAGYHLYLLSNAQAAYTVNEIKMFELDKDFEKIYLSSDYGYCKPDIRFYRELMKDQNIKPEECMMIGNDANTDIQGGRNAGMKTLYVRTDMAEGIPESDYEIEGNDWKKIAQKIIKMNL
ncbi:MAG: HAD family hydrolase [Erysipelotrichaceae bacterium]|nr:HAD family hydrolase [Erysipelotrichaceae bacterium]